MNIHPFLNEVTSVKICKKSKDHFIILKSVRQNQLFMSPFGSDTAVEARSMN
jgi:hypothetical protein